MTDDDTCLHLQALVAAAEPWSPVETIEVDCHDAGGFTTGEPVVRAGAAVAPGAHRVQAGDVLLSAGTQGPRRAWVVGESRGRPQIAAAGWHVLRSDAVAADYLRHVIVSDDFQRRLAAIQPRSRDRRRAAAELPDIAWSVPTMQRQQRIGQLLDHVDVLRSRRARVVRCANELLQSLFAQLFGETSMANQCLVPLRDVLVDVPVRGVDAQLGARGSFPVLRPADIREGRLSLADVRYVSYSNAALARSALADGDVLLVCEPGRGDMRSAIARPGQGVWFMHARVWRLRTDARRLLPEYLHAWLLSTAGREETLRAWVADRRVPVEARLGSIVVPLPAIERQRAFAEGANALDRLEGRLHASAERLAELLATLRNLAFRGELSLD